MDINRHYEVEFTEECLNEIKKVYNYISNNLYAENSAKKLMNMVEEFIKNLACVPEMYAEIEKYHGTNKIYRRIVIKNYVLLYTIDEENKKVFVSHMYYGGMDYLR